MHIYKISRRRFLKALGIVSATGSSALCFAEGLASDPSLEDLLNEPIISEPQFGDPLGPQDKFETLTLLKPSQQKAVGDDPVSQEKDPKQLARRMLKLTSDFVKGDVSRWHNVLQVVEFLNIVDYESPDTPFCAAGVSYAACRAYCDLTPKQETYDPDITPKRITLFKHQLTTIYHHYFFPSASVRIIKADAIKKGKWVDQKSVVPLPGWLVIFSWDGGSAGNHIGLVESAAKGDGFITTLEYNTSAVSSGDQRNSGCVARKKRPLDKHVLGYVKIYDKS